MELAALGRQINHHSKYLINKLRKIIKGGHSDYLERSREARLCIICDWN
jgi:hypothetical protein